MFLAGAFAIAAVSTEVRCSRPKLESFITEFKTARDAMGAHPSQSFEQLTDIDQRLEGCIQVETDKELRFKLVLFSTGIHAYIGAADAESGNISRGKATADAAVERAKALVRQSRANPSDLKLANELVFQLDRPLRLIREAQRKHH
ncbi:MAG: hypothetical protein JO177_07125 [Candidatus Eremiobacteraeota bacterium]|nr:hypothetical protein [Candidatus Eremiobacteraeota bacterium]